MYHHLLTPNQFLKETDMSNLNSNVSNAFTKKEMIEICKSNVESYFAYNKDDIPIEITERVGLGLCYLENELKDFTNYIKNIKVNRSKIHTSLINTYLTQTNNNNPIFRYC